jgi:hypothetical protein
MELSKIKKRVILEMRCNGISISENDIVVHNNKDIFILGVDIGYVRSDVMYIHKDLASKAEKITAIAAELGRDVKISNLDEIIKAVSRKVLLSKMTLNIDKAWK